MQVASLPESIDFDLSKWALMTTHERPPRSAGGGKQGEQLRGPSCWRRFALLPFVVASRLDLFEASADLLRSHEDVNVDEVVMAALTTVVAMAV